MSAMLPFSPRAGLYLKDDFLGNDLVADTTVGELGWDLDQIGTGGSTVTKLVTTNVEVDCYGVIRLLTDVTAAGDGLALRLLEDTIVLGGGGGYFATKFRVPAITGNTFTDHMFRIGLQDVTTLVQPTVGIWLDSDEGALTLQADSADHGDVTLTPSGYLNTLTADNNLTLDTWYTAVVEWGHENAQGGPEEIRFYLNGEAMGSITDCAIDDDEEMEFAIQFTTDDGADSLELDIDFVELFIGRATSY